MTKTATPGDTSGALGSFDIFILGTRSSGKSVLLASLYQKLSALNGVTNFFARCDDHKQDIELRETYIQLLDTKADWPSGTYRADSYDLSCFHHLRGKGVRLFSIRFHDYPGGYVTDLKVNRFIDQRIDQCSTVMALIDGRKMLDRLLDQETNPAHALHRDLDDLVRVLQHCVGKPIHFILTKSDLFNNVNFPLEVIAAELRRHAGFNDICIQQKDAGDTCYLIPVSAVGPKFAHIDPADGRIKKSHNGTIEPFNLDVMLSASIVDTVLELARTDIESSAKDGAGPRTLAARLPPWLSKTLMYLRLIAPAAGGILGRLTALGITGICLGAEKYIDNKRLSYDQKVSEIRRTIHNRTSAIEAILKIQMQLLDGWLKKAPASTLGVRFDPVAMLIPRETPEETPHSDEKTWLASHWIETVSTAALVIGLVLPNRSAVYGLFHHADKNAAVVCSEGVAPGELGAPAESKSHCTKSGPQPSQPLKPETEQSLFQQCRESSDDSKERVALFCQRAIDEEHLTNSQMAQAYETKGVVEAWDLEAYDNGQEDISKAIQIEPTADRMVTRGNINFNRDRMQDAANDYTAAVSLNPKCADCYLNRGDAYTWERQYAKAMDDYDQSIKLDPGVSNSWSRRASLKAILKRWESALSDYKKAFALGTEGINDLKEAYTYRGLCSYNIGDYENAVTYETAAIARKPEDAAFAHYIRGLAFHELKLSKLAADDFQVAVRQNLSPELVSGIPK